jgi:outer membrane protein assembly factor BamB
MGDRNEEQFVICIDLATQKELWAAKVGKPWGDGPRSTPTVDGERVYAIGTHGDLVCVESATGEEVWRKNFGKDFGGKMMSGWGYSESPLVDGDKLVCTPGGPDAMMVALDKKTGETIWKCAMPNIGSRGKDGAGYASIVPDQVGEVRMYVQITGRGAIGVSTDGKFLWGYNKIANGTANIPNVVVEDDYVFCTTSYKTGSALLKLVPTEGGIKAEEVYFLTPDQFENHHGGVVLVDGYIYGGDGQNQGAPVCLEMKTGKIMWKEKPVGNGSAAVLYADSRLYFRYDNALMALIEATPTAFKVTGSFELPSKTGPSWPHPVISDGKLYLRDNDVLLCYDVAEKKAE